MGSDLKGKQLGTGLYQRKDGRYEARARINGIHVNLFNTNLAQLKRDFNAAKEKAKNDINVRNSKMTLNEWFEEWFTIYKLPQVKETSIYPMKNKYYSNFGKVIGDMRLVDIRNLDIMKAINEMKNAGRATSSMRDALGRVRECLEAAKNNRMIDINPCFSIVVPWENKQVQRRFLSRDEQRRFLQEVAFNWYKEMFYIMFLTGLRVGEIGGLKWSDVDFENKCINVNRSLSIQYEGGVKKMRLTTPKTHNSYRRIPFLGEAEEMLLAQKQKVELLKKTLGKRWRSDEEYADLVFVSSMGSPAVRHIVEKEINKVVKDLNQQEAHASVQEQRAPKYFEHMYPHAIRHTFCSRCFEANMHPKVVQGLMGHQHYSTTIDIYTHVTDDKFVEETGKLGPAMGGEEEVKDGQEVCVESEMSMSGQGYGFMGLG